MADGTIRIETAIDDSGIAEGLARLGEMAALAFAGLQERVGEALLPLPEQLAQVGMLASQALADALMAGGASVAAGATAMGDMGAEAARMALSPDVGMTVGMDFAGGVAAGIDGAAGTVAASAASAGAAGVSAAGAALNAGAGYSIGVSFGMGMASGIASTAGAVAAAAASVAQAAYAAATSALAVRSPSRVMRWVGEMFGAGFAQGIDGTEDAARQAARGLSRAAVMEMAGAGQMAVARGHRGAGVAAGVRLAEDARGRGGQDGRQGDAVTVRVEAVHVHAEKLEGGQDWQAAGRALADAFGREVRYRGLLRR